MSFSNIPNSTTTLITFAISSICNIKTYNIIYVFVLIKLMLCLFK